MVDPGARPGASLTTIDSQGAARANEDLAPEIVALVIAWSAHEPERVGEVAVLSNDRGTVQVLGRGASDPGAEPRLRFFRQRPGTVGATPPLASPGMSRRQLLVYGEDGGARLERVGRCTLHVNGGKPCDSAVVRPGDTIFLSHELLLYCAQRPALIPRSRFLPDDVTRGFGDADALGLLGESPHMWRLRDSVAFAAKTQNHVLIAGESGTGKELVARAVHLLSGATATPFVARNAATLPLGLVDAELFGNVKNYPNVGMPERAGLIGEADGGTLFLDEIGELPIEQQARLLRVLDAGGEYQRLGEAKTRRSRFRLLAATNRPPSVLKEDFAARLASRIDVPALAMRREDLPLLARHLLERAARGSPDLAARFIERASDGSVTARFDPLLVEHVLARPFRTNLRELDALLWKSIADSAGDVLSLPADLRSAPSASRQPAARELAPSTERREPSPEEITKALEQHDGNVPRAARALGLSSRFVLNRLMKRHGIAASPGAKPEDD